MKFNLVCYNKLFYDDISKSLAKYNITYSKEFDILIVVSPNIGERLMHEYLSMNSIEEKRLFYDHIQSSIIKCKSHVIFICPPVIHGGRYEDSMDASIISMMDIVYNHSKKMGLSKKLGTVFVEAVYGMKEFDHQISMFDSIMKMCSNVYDNGFIYSAINKKSKRRLCKIDSISEAIIYFIKNMSNSTIHITSPLYTVDNVVGMAASLTGKKYNIAYYDQGLISEYKINGPTYDAGPQEDRIREAFLLLDK